MPAEYVNYGIGGRPWALRQFSYTVTATSVIARFQKTRTCATYQNRDVYCPGCIEAQAIGA
jgi:hypothetical protein